ncbi:aminotransferase class III-fold pyridoxal phosphate-dependent enzyme [Sabulicella glaciei]|uniref:Aminotransferase class III-fold pyridoxal phosphate-dependent enzyme n=1 Tax=Sabulicella glaciei TaxID=2984948 RepID=A0ABT3NPW3_9PROT|nr:aminotransferase class III-fold pyridoxal phosphate-dependent enzyme [Roseococcus sp. MDT2-1-1]MCW8084201.1 aminotransferase class III-fold pyridoxal phosphate-dependent enzyme [Roseococcus sp. MDT2-1-1]
MSTDAALRARAARVVPGGMWGHLHAGRMPPGYPQFFTRGEGGHVWDADGRRYVDLMCAWGPVILGHRDGAVEGAAARQAALGDCLNGPAPVMVDLAERLVDRIAHADWAIFCKNGTDATTACVTIARAATGRRAILVAEGSYHGAMPWCTPVPAGTTAEDRAHQHRFRYNDIASLEAAADAAGPDLAGIIVTAFRHDNVVDQEMPEPGFARAARAICDRRGAALIVDDVRAGFRLHPDGSWEAVGVRPDLSAYSKALGNGHAIAAIAGSEALREAAGRVFVTGSFWCAAVPMAAALAVLEELERRDVVPWLEHLGTRLRQGLAQRAVAFGVGLRQSGPVSMPLFMFDGDADFAQGRAFCAAALAAGAYLHPRHNMFLCAAHTEADMDEVLRAAEAGFEALRGA